MKKIKPHKKKGNSSKHLPTMKKENKRKEGKEKVNQAIIENVQKRLEPYHSILVHRPIEVIPVHDEEHLRKLQESYQRESRYRDEMRKNSDIIFSPRPDHPTVILKSDFMFDIPSLLEKVELGLRIGKFIKTRDQNLAARIIKDFPEIIFNDCAEIYLWLFISHSLSELSEILQQWHTDVSIFTGVLGENPFAVQIYNWQFSNIWGNRRRQKEAKKYLKEVGLEVFSYLLRKGKPRGSGVSNKKVREAYKIILTDFQGFFSGEGKPKYTVHKQKMLRQYISDKKLLKYFPPFIGFDSEFDEKRKVDMIVDKLLGEDRKGKLEPEYVGKKGSDRKIVKINPFNPSNIALHLTGLIYGISPDTVRSILYRK